MKWSLSFAGLGVVVLLIVFSRVESQAPVRAGADQLVEIEIQQLELTRFGAAGEKLEQSKAAHAVKYEGAPETRLRDVWVEHEDKQGGHWTLFAPTGSSEASNDAMTLSGGVTILRGEALQLETQEIKLDALTNLAVSDTQTRLVSDRSETTAAGLIIDLDAGTARLAGNVASQYRQDKTQ